MIQTENTAIVLRRVNYRENDRMVTLLRPSRGRIDAVIRNLTLVLQGLPPVHVINRELGY